MRNFISKFNADSFISIIIMVCRFVAKICIGAIIFVAICHFIPELRELLPDLYRIVDHILANLLNDGVATIANLF